MALELKRVVTAVSEDGRAVFVEDAALEPIDVGVMPGFKMYDRRVIEGELHLELDDGAEVRLPTGSCVVQNGTRHAWSNRADVPAKLASVILGARAEA